MNEQGIFSAENYFSRLIKLEKIKTHLLASGREQDMERLVRLEERIAPKLEKMVQHMDADDMTKTLSDRAGELRKWHNINRSLLDDVKTLTEIFFRGSERTSDYGDLTESRSRAFSYSFTA
jgi:hypothetical protein